MNAPTQKYETVTEKYIVQDGGPALLIPATLSTQRLVEALGPYRKYKVGMTLSLISSSPAFYSLYLLSTSLSKSLMINRGENPCLVVVLRRLSMC